MKLSFNTLLLAFMMFLLPAWKITSACGGLVAAEYLYTPNSGFTIDGLSPEQASRFFLRYVNAYQSLVPAFFKQGFSHEWRALSTYPLDTVARKSFNNRLRFTVVPLAFSGNFIAYDLQAELFREKIFLPQLTVSFNHTFVIPINDYSRNISFHSFSLAGVLSKSISHYHKILFGYRLTLMNGMYHPVSSLATNIDFLSIFNYVIVGFSYLPKTTNWKNTIYVGLDPINKSLYYYVEWASRFFSFGLTSEPAKILAIKPFFKLHISI